MLSVIFLCFVVYQVHAADDNWCDADMKVVCQTTFRSWEAALKGAEIAILGSVNLYYEASEHILAGYYFLPGIAEHDRSNPALRESGVREFICEKRQFVSNTLQRCLKKIEEALDGKADVQTSRPMLCRKLTKDIARSKFSLGGETRKWSVVTRQDIKKFALAERVFLVFRGESEVLVGQRCAKDEVLPSSDDSLFYFQHQPFFALPTTLSEDIPSPEDILSPSCGCCYNFGVVYFSSKSQRSAALFNAPLRELCIIYRWDGAAIKEEMVFFDILKTVMLNGCFLKNKTKSTANVDVLRQPYVRDVACRRQEFTDVFLDMLLKKVQLFLQEEDITFQAAHDFWRGLRQEELACPDAKKIVWSIISQEDLRRTLDEGASQEVVMLLLQGERAALQGRFVPKDYVVADEVARSLFDVLCEQKIKQFREKGKEINA